jgi:mitotic spindle assembly checkpoint protein MAD1
MLTINVPLLGHTSEDHTTTSTSDYLSLQHRLSQLSAAHSLCGQTIAAKQSTILDYSGRLEQISRETAMTLDELQKRAETAERENRWANEGRQSAEKRLRLAREELEMLRSSKVSSSSWIERGVASAKTLPCAMPYVQSSVSLQEGPGDSVNIVELQRQVNIYRQAIDDFQSDNRETQAKAILDLDLVKRSDLTSALDRCKQLEQGRLLRPLSLIHRKLTRHSNPYPSEIEKFKQMIVEHEERYEDIRKAAEDMENRLGSGEYNAKVWRVVEFGGNPAAKDYAIRKETLEKLKQENEAQELHRPEPERRQCLSKCSKG